jgi:AraC-like DNA-binding protein
LINDAVRTMSRLDKVESWPRHAQLAHYSVRELARLCHTSSSQLRRYFIARFGVPPKRWLTELRLKRVAILTRESTFSLKEIAAQLSFASESVLCHQFKKHFGCKPSEYGFRLLSMMPKDAPQSEQEKPGLRHARSDNELNG